MEFAQHYQLRGPLKSVFAYLKRRLATLFPEKREKKKVVSWDVATLPPLLCSFRIGAPHFFFPFCLRLAIFPSTHAGAMFVFLFQREPKKESHLFAYPFRRYRSQPVRLCSVSKAASFTELILSSYPMYALSSNLLPPRSYKHALINGRRTVFPRESRRVGSL